ncbi:MAG: glycosyltransferase family 4 protein [Bacteroidota bacterium]
MEIIHLVLGKANPERMNGVNKVAHNLCTTQSDLGMKVDLWGITPNREKNYPDRNYETTLFDSKKSKFSVDQELKSAIDNLKPGTVVHMHGAFIPEFYHISGLLKKAKVPYVFTPHGSYAPGAMEKNPVVKNVYFKLAEQRILKNAKAIQLLGKSEFENLGRMLRLQNRVMIPNGQDMNEIPSLEKTYSNTDPVFGFCGRIDIRHKGLDLFFKGFREFLNKGGHGHIELIGNGTDMERLQKLGTQLELEKHVTYHGAMFGAGKFDVINAFDLFVHTSRMEGFPTAVLEAAALQVPCITSEPTNASDYIRDYNAGFTIDVNEPKFIANAFLAAEKAFRNGELPAKGANGLKMVLQEFSWEKVAKDLIEVYAA